MKRLFIIFMLVVSLVLSIGIALAEDGWTAGTAFTMYPDVERTQYWTYNNYKKNCYNKFSLPAQGFIDFVIQKPIDSDGDICSFTLTIYNSIGAEVWCSDTKDQKDNFFDVYTNRIGLAAGTYYINIKPNFFVYRNSAAIPTSYHYSFTPTMYFEIESNNSLLNANALQYNRMYSAVYCDEAYSSSNDYEDFFTFEGVANKEFDIIISNLSQLKSTLIYWAGPSGTEKSIKFSFKPQADGTSLFYCKTLYDGTYYIRLTNCGNQTGVEFQIGVYEHGTQPEATPAPTPVATPIPSVEPTPVCTPEPTPVSTPEPTPEPDTTLTVVSNVSMNPGTALQLQPSQPGVENPTFTYKTSSKKIAKVSTSGLITAVKTGTANITVTSSHGETAKVKVTVKDVKIKLNKTKVTLAIKKNFTIKATQKNTFGAKYTYKSSNAKIAKVSKQGVVTGVKKGTATITVTSSFGQKATLKVTVK